MNYPFMDLLKANSEQDCPLYSNKDRWRPYPAKHARVKVAERNGKFVLMLKVERYPGFVPSVRNAYNDIYRKFNDVPAAKFDTFYDAVVAAKVLLDWLQEPLRDAELFSGNGTPCYSVKSAKFAIRPNSDKSRWRIHDLDENIVIDLCDTREDAIKKMIDQGTSIGPVFNCI